MSKENSSQLIYEKIIKDFYGMRYEEWLAVRASIDGLFKEKAIEKEVNLDDLDQLKRYLTFR